ncbi:MAG: hypothetical protein LCH99_34765, partial [Proteobacteria bacterium]|nr:hypothetical protein [Pseudomonadota bacterium]
MVGSLEVIEAPVAAFFAIPVGTNRRVGSPADRATPLARRRRSSSSSSIRDEARRAEKASISPSS